MLPSPNSNSTTLAIPARTSLMRRALIFACAALLSGCAATERVVDMFGSRDTNDAKDARQPAALLEFEQQLSAVELWKKDSGAGVDERYLKLTPVVVNQHVYVVDSTGSLTALDATNGARLWQTKIATGAGADGGGWLRRGGIRITGGPGYGDNTLLVGTGEGELITLAADDGSELWRARVTSEILSAPQRAANIVVVRTIDGKIFGIDGVRGKRLWIYDRTVPPLTLRGTGAPTIADGIVVAGFDGGKLAALELRNGKLLWEASITAARGRSELERMVDIDAQPVIADGAVYIVTFQGHVAAAELETGRILWSNDLSSFAGLSADDDYVYVTDEDSHIHALDRVDGATIWKQEDLRARAVTAPTVVDGQVVVGDLEGYLHWLDRANGVFTARTRLCRQPIIAQPIAVGSVIYAYCSDGRLAAYMHR